MIYLYIEKLSLSLDGILTIKVDKRRALVDYIVKRAKEEAAITKKKIETVDPLLRVGRQLYPYLSERELQECACLALRLIRYGGIILPQQTTLMSEK